MNMWGDCGILRECGRRPWVCDIYKDVDVCDGVCGGEAFDGGGEFGISGILRW